MAPPQQHSKLAAAAALFSVLIGVLLSPLPRNFGFYHWLAYRNYKTNPKLVGMVPATEHGVPWKYTFEELYANDLTGQTALVTGANSGLGYETSLALARLGASVTLACRNPAKCESAKSKIQSDSRYKNKKGGGAGRVTTMTVDTSSLRSVKSFAELYLKENKGGGALDMLFLNAGIGSAGMAKDGRTLPLSEDGIEMVFATNHVGHHLLYKILEPLVLRSRLARVVLTSSSGSFDTFPFGVATDIATLNGHDADPLKTYGQSKLAQIVWAKELTRRLAPVTSTVYVNAVHPGAVDTGIWGKNPGIPAWVKRVIAYLQKNVMWTPEEAALTMLYVGVAVDQLVKKDIRGRYFHPQSQEVVNPLALNETLQRDLWEFSDELVKDFV